MMEKMERFAVGDRVRMVHPALLVAINNHDECISWDKLRVGQVYTVKTVSKERKGLASQIIELKGKEWWHPACLFRKVI